MYVNGQRALSNNVIINGVDANSIGTGENPNLSVPSIDSLQEFIVQTSMYDASAGRNAGGNVAAVTKSGTNRFHGDVYEFLRNTGIGRQQFLPEWRKGVVTARPAYRRNQFGGTLGRSAHQGSRLVFYLLSGNPRNQWHLADQLALYDVSCPRF